MLGEARRGDAGRGRDDAPETRGRCTGCCAIAKYDERYVIPKAHRELGANLIEQQGACGLDFAGGPGTCGAVRNPAAQGNGRFMLKKSLRHPRPGTSE